MEMILRQFGLFRPISFSAMTKETCVESSISNSKKIVKSNLFFRKPDLDFIDFSKKRQVTIEIQKLNILLQKAMSELENYKYNIEFLKHELFKKQRTLSLLEEPLQKYEKKISYKYSYEDEEFAKKILSEIINARLNTKDKLKINLCVGWYSTISECTTDLLIEFLALYQIEALRVSEKVFIDVCDEHLQIKLPKDIPELDIQFSPDFESMCDSEKLLRLIHNELGNINSRVQDIVEKELILLQEKLYDPIRSGAQQAFAKIQPPSKLALNKFQDLLIKEDLGLVLEQHNAALFTLTRSSPKLRSSI